MLDRMDSQIPTSVRRIVLALEEAGESAWIVGGCIRDLLIGREVHDWDLATTAHPEKVLNLFDHVIPTGIAHGTVTVMIKGVGYEVTTLRGEGKYSDGRRPDDVRFVKTIEEDLERRDFTMNAIAYSPISGEFVDPFGGRQDIENKIIRAVRDPMLRFSEDGLRSLRGARFCSTLEFMLESSTYEAIAKTLEVTAKVAPERVQAEFDKILLSKNPGRALCIMKDTGILRTVAPAIAAIHNYTFSDAMMYVQTLDTKDAHVRGVVRLALLLEPLGAQGAVDQLKALRYSNDVQRDVKALVAHANPPDRTIITRPQARAFLRSLGRDHLCLWLWALKAKSPSVFTSWTGTVIEERDANMVFSAADLVLKGDEVVAIVGKPGPKVKQVLDRLVEFVEEDPTNNQRLLLLEKAHTVFKELQ